MDALTDGCSRANNLYISLEMYIYPPTSSRGKCYNDDIVPYCRNYSKIISD